MHLDGEKVLQNCSGVEICALQLRSADRIGATISDARSSIVATQSLQIAL